MKEAAQAPGASVSGASSGWKTAIRKNWLLVGLIAAGIVLATFAGYHVGKTRLSAQKRVGLSSEVLAGQAEHYDYLSWLDASNESRFTALAQKSSDELRQWQTATRNAIRKRLMFPYDGTPQMVATGEQNENGLSFREWHARLNDKTLFRFFEVNKGGNKQPEGPVLVLFQGHGNVDQLLRDEASYQRATGKYFASLGYHVYVMENVGMGPDDAADAHLHLDGLLSLRGYGWYSLLLSHQDALLKHVLAQHSPGTPIGLAGVSTGGLLALFGAALNEAVTSASVHGIFAHMSDSFGRDYAEHCPCGSIDGLLPEFDLPTLALLVAPRPLHVNNSEQDRFTPRDARRALERLEPVRLILGGAHVVFTSPPGKHSFALAEAKSFFGSTLPN
jgi:dienelactone hydrolase